MTVYMDTSVVLRRLLGQPGSLLPWGGWDAVVTSALTRVEFSRVVDRLRLQSAIDDVQRVELQSSFDLLWRAVHRVPLAEGILSRAAQPFPTVVGTLDALHMASALAARSGDFPELTVLTHDRQLGRAAMAMEFPVMGI